MPLLFTPKGEGADRFTLFHIPLRFMDPLHLIDGDGAILPIPFFLYLLVEVGKIICPHRIQNTP